MRRPSDAGLFTDDRSPLAWDHLVPSNREIMNLHWVSEFVDHGTFLRKLPPSLPVVWTLHDMNAFTGGCHYTGGCTRYTEQCGRCPQLGSREPGDLSHQVWRRKQRAFGMINPEQLTVVCPSEWLSGRAAASPLLERFGHRVIPNGVDTEVFAPREKRACRELLGIRDAARVVLFVADHVAEARKGFDILCKSLADLSGQMDDLHLLCMGGGRLPASLSVPATFTGQVMNEHLMSAVYSAADAFAIPSLEDNLPNTVLEAMACGVPVVGFKTGGIPDVVMNGKTGIVASQGTPSEFTDGLYEILSDSDLQQAFSEGSRKRIVEHFSQELMAERYLALFTEAIADTRGHGSND